MFFALLGGGLLFLALLLYVTGDIEFQRAVGKVVKRLLKTGALRQLAGILGAMVFVRYGLEPLIKNIRVMMKAQGSWEKSSEYYILREASGRALESWHAWLEGRAGLRGCPVCLACGGWWAACALWRAQYALGSHAAD